MRFTRELTRQLLARSVQYRGYTIIPDAVPGTAEPVRFSVNDVDLLATIVDPRTRRTGVAASVAEAMVRIDAQIAETAELVRVAEATAAELVALARRARKAGTSLSEIAATLSGIAGFGASCAAIAVAEGA